MPRSPMSTEPVPQPTITAEDWPRIEAWLDCLLDRSPARQQSALARIARREPQLAAQLRSLLAQVGGADPLLDHPALDFDLEAGAAPAAAMRAEADQGSSVITTAAAAGRDGSVEAAADQGQIGRRIGAYRLQALIGRGGTSEVWRATRDDGAFAQRVALKLIHDQGRRPSARFRCERAALARLEHPGIARLIDAGLSEDDRPYLVMELVDGLPITAWCRRRCAGLHERLRLFAEVCSAVAHAHQHRVIHGDLKPSNVLVSADGRVRLLDFGVARLLDEPDSTATRSIPLTPGYAAPEQIRGEAITEATDVHALGLLLYELLTGAPPWHLAELPLLTALDKLLREDAPPASRQAAAQPAPPVPPARLRGDLDAILAKALRKPPAARYDSVRALAQDVQRSQRHQPVAAREGARLYALGRFMVRYRLPLASAVIAASALLGSLFAIVIEARIAHDEAEQAEAAHELLLGAGATVPASREAGRTARLSLPPLQLPADDDQAVLAATTARSTRSWLLVPP